MARMADAIEKRRISFVLLALSTLFTTINADAYIQSEWSGRNNWWSRPVPGRGGNNLTPFTVENHGCREQDHDIRFLEGTAIWKREFPPNDYRVEVVGYLPRNYCDGRGWKTRNEPVLFGGQGTPQEIKKRIKNAPMLLLVLDPRINTGIQIINLKDVNIPNTSLQYLRSLRPMDIRELVGEGGYLKGEDPERLYGKAFIREDSDEKLIFHQINRPFKIFKPYDLEYESKDAQISTLMRELAEREIDPADPGSHVQSEMSIDALVELHGSARGVKREQEISPDTNRGLHQVILPPYSSSIRGETFQISILEIDIEPPAKIERLVKALVPEETKEQYLEPVQQNPRVDLDSIDPETGMTFRELQMLEEVIVDPQSYPSNEDSDRKGGMLIESPSYPVVQKSEYKSESPLNSEESSGFGKAIFAISPESENEYVSEEVIGPWKYEEAPDDNFDTFKRPPSDTSSEDSPSSRSLNGGLSPSNDIYDGLQQQNAPSIPIRHDSMETEEELFNNGLTGATGTQDFLSDYPGDLLDPSDMEYLERFMASVNKPNPDTDIDIIPKAQD